MLFCWLAIQRSLKTQDKLKDWGIIPHSLCVLCSSAEENEDHLYGECPYVKLIWSSLLYLMGYTRMPGSWDEEISWCSTNLGTDGIAVVRKLYFSSMVYNVWAERNTRQHSGPYSPAHKVLNNIKLEVSLRVSTLNIKAKDCPKNKALLLSWNMHIPLHKSNIIWHSWSAPPIGKVRVNTDGSLVGDLGGIGAVIRDHEGKVLAAAHGSRYNLTVPELELEGIYMGMQLALRENYHHILLNSDSLSCISLVKQQAKAPWHLVRRVDGIVKMSTRFQSFSISHIPRETNQAADHLASLRANSAFVRLNQNEFSPSFIGILKGDSEGKKIPEMHSLVTSKRVSSDLSSWVICSSQNVVASGPSICLSMSTSISLCSPRAFLSGAWPSFQASVPSASQDALIPLD